MVELSCADCIYRLLYPAAINERATVLSSAAITKRREIDSEPRMLSCRLFILFQVFAYGICSDEADMPIQYVKTITDADFDGFVKASNSSHVRVVYFYKKGKH